MNKLLSLSLVPLAATATVASIAFTPDSAQAIGVGKVEISSFPSPQGGVTYDPVANILKFGETPAEVDQSTIDGILPFTGVAISDIALNPAKTEGVVSNPFLTFLSSGITFEANNPLNIDFFTNGGGFISFNGTFVDGGDTVVASGIFTGQWADNGSYSMTIEAVPEPLTILGTGLALGLGGLFKSKQSKKQSLEA